MVEPYATKVLVKERHERLVADIENCARYAGILPRCIWTRMPEDAPEEEMGYISGICRHLLSGSPAGLCYTGSGRVGAIEHRMGHVAGLLVRNSSGLRGLT